MTAVLRAAGIRTAAFRRCVGLFPTGVAVVAVEHRGAPAGMTVSSFTSVSLDPLLVSVCLAHSSRTLRAVRAARRFAVSVLRTDQRDVARAFAASGAPFPAELTHRHDDGHVAVAGAVAVLRCTLAQTVRAGDHDLLLGRVESFDTAPGEPLVYLRGAFR